MNTVTENCKDCRFYGKNLGNCDYFEIMNALRPCPPGDECTVKEVRGRTPDVFDPEKKPKRGGSQRKGVVSWDIERAYKLWMESLKVIDIGEMVGISPGTISAYAAKHGWPKEHRPARGGYRRKDIDVQEETESGAGSTGTEEAAAAVDEGTAGSAEAARPERDRLGSCDRKRSASEPAAPSHRGEEGDQEVNDPKNLSLYDVLEVATAELTGIQAVATADALANLWNWKDKSDLEQARNAIDFLIRKMEVSNGTV